MNDRIRSLLVAAYLLACIVFGGSAQSPWNNLGLQVGGILVIAWVAVSGNRFQDRSAIVVETMIICTLVLVLLQLIPLPQILWAILPGREEIAAGQAALGYGPRMFSASEMPSRSVLTLFAVIPGIAAFFAASRLGTSPRAVAAAIALGMIASVLVGAFQLGGGPGSPWYLYEIHSPGSIGFFANGNHMGTLLLVSVPVISALVASPRARQGSSDVGRYALGAVAFGVVIVGILLNGSRAAIALSVPVILASVSLVATASRWRRAALGLSAVALVGGVIFLLSSPLTSAGAASNSGSSVHSRAEVWSTTFQAAKDTFPVGTGLGTFEPVYPLYEDPNDVNRSYVNHAHNDYLEILLELGAGGLLLMLGFLAWWAITTYRIWTYPHSTPFARAATIASGAILAHSAVDFPLRTAAILAIFGACVGAMTPHFRARAETGSGKERPIRHRALA